MILFYNFVTSIAPALLKLVSPFSSKVKTWLEATATWKEDILASGIGSSKCNVWFHCASLGEYEQGKPVMEALKLEYPEVSIIVTFFSPSGYKARKNSNLASYVGYLPMDTYENSREFVQIVSPKLAFFVKSEIWPNFINALKAKHIPMFLLSARFYDKQTIFKKRGGLFKAQLRKFDLIFVQNKSSQVLLKKHKTDSIYSGDTRYDQVAQLLDNKKEYPLIKKFIENRPVFLAGSCWPEDVAVLKTFLKETKSKIILAPHDVSEKMINQVISDIGLPSIRYSTFSAETNLSGFNVLIIDCIGMLASLYDYCTVAYVGGAFKQGLHNILEPAVYGVPVVFGPQIEEFAEAGEMIKNGGAFSCNTNDEMYECLKKLFANEIFMKEAGEANRMFTNTKKGATEIVMRNVKTVASNLPCFSKI
ncbi:MAG: 3-deoxy-D-manno-octulosonic acid transferase [Opitutaceae bacterium]|nr:3-deoxy-D-manno-octulosonic acid transferase [Cytophagales bacterium]